MARLEGYGPSYEAVRQYNYDTATDRICDIFATTGAQPFGEYLDSDVDVAYGCSVLGFSFTDYTKEYAVRRVHGAVGVDSRDIDVVQLGRPFRLGGLFAFEVDLSQLPADVRSDVLDKHILHGAGAIDSDAPMAIASHRRNQLLVRAYPSVLHAVVHHAGELAQDLPTGVPPNQHFVDEFAHGFAFTSARLRGLVGAALQTYNGKLVRRAMDTAHEPVES